MLLAGIDEAGYGPLLGPLCVGLTAFRIPAQSPPDLWKLLAASVARRPDKKNRIAVADSKALKLANDSKVRHPLTHLERGVLAFLAASSPLPDDDAQLFKCLGFDLPGHACYAVAPVPLPLSASAAELAIASNMIRRACAAAACELVGVRCHAIGEDEFNAIVTTRGTKAEATLAAIAQHFRTLLRWQRDTGEDIHLICDRLGGRQSYAPVLSTLMIAAGAPACVSVLSETPEVSIYAVRHDQGSLRVEFRVEGESCWLPTALASMTAKLTRELAMHRFNRYWQSRLAELKPTAGYYNDAHRWLKDAAGVLTDADRRSLIRRA